MTRCGTRLGPCLAMIGVLILWATTATQAAAPVLLADPSAPLEGIWAERRFGPPTDYRRVVVDGRPAIRARGTGTASGLFRTVALRLDAHPILEWSWRVDRVPVDADIRTRSGHDVAAAVYVIFGRPGLFARKVPTLAYVWDNGTVAPGTVVPSPFHAGTVRSFVLRSGLRPRAAWVEERRDLVADFRAVFGFDPPSAVEAIALWTDSDQTGAPVEAYYGRIVALPRTEAPPAR